MFGWLYVLPHLLFEAGAARRDARIRFLKAPAVEILHRKLGGNRVIPSPDDRVRLLALGAELGHHVAEVIGIVTPQTYSRWVVEQRKDADPGLSADRRSPGMYEPWSRGWRGKTSAGATAASLGNCGSCGSKSAARPCGEF